ncbi:hypothetical protein ACN6KF_000136 [Labrys sp. La1]
MRSPRLAVPGLSPHACTARMTSATAGPSKASRKPNTMPVEVTIG